MATITLTDRISVRVTAKDSTESSDQKKRDGGNTATALGGTGLTDSEKEQLGESLGETVTGEDGRTYARSDKVAGVLKQIADAGKLSEPTEVHKGLTDENGDNWNFGTVYFPAGVPVVYSDPSNLNSGYKYLIEENSQPATECYIAFARYQYDSDTSVTKVYIFSKELPSSAISYYRRDASDDRGRGGASVTLSAHSVTINGVSYSFFAASLSANKTDYNFTLAKLEQCGYSANTIQETNDYLKYITGYLFGAVEQSGGAKVDPTGKTDAQIKKDLEDFAALNNCKMTSESGDSYIAVTDANGNPLYFLGT